MVELDTVEFDSVVEFIEVVLLTGMVLLLLLVELTDELLLVVIFPRVPARSPKLYENMVVKSDSGIWKLLSVFYKSV